MASHDEVLVQGTQDTEMELPQQYEEGYDFGRRASVLGRLAARTALVIGVALGTTVGEVAALAPISVAEETGSYPDVDATDCSAMYGIYSWCKPGDDWISPRSYGYRNCTDWVAFRVPQLVGRAVPSGWGNAKNWDDAAIAAHKAVDSTPEQGDIAVWNGGDFGHVEVVESVNADGSVNTSGYNKHGDGTYDLRPNQRADAYIDLNGPNSPAPPSGPPYGSTTIGIYDPAGATFHPRDFNTPGPAGVSIQFGNANWIPLAGDWDSNGTFTPGAYDPATGWFYLRNSHTAGPADRSFQYGNVGWKPLAGDWDGNGYWSVGLYDPNTSTFYLKNFNGSGGADTVASFGNGNWLPIAGDWDGPDDGNRQTTIGVYDPATATFHLNNENDSGAADRTFQYGNIGWKPLAGDWNGNRYWSIGTYDPSNSTFYLRNLNTSGPADVTVQYGNAGWLPVVGDWNAG